MRNENIAANEGFEWKSPHHSELVPDDGSLDGDRVYGEAFEFPEFTASADDLSSLTGLSGGLNAKSLIASSK